MNESIVSNPSAIIIGGGPAGISAGIQLHRSGIAVQLIERTRLGGLLWNANWVENYPGFPNGISGRDLAQLVCTQFERFNIPTLIGEQVQQINWKDDLFHVTTDTRSFSSEYLILATGTPSIPLDVDGIAQIPPDRSLNSCLDLKGLSGKRVSIIGAGDSAFDQALNLANEHHVTINNRGERISALGLLVKWVSKTPTIAYRTNFSLKKVAMQGDELLLTWQTPNGELQETTDYLLTAIGRRADFGVLKDIKPFLRGYLIKCGRLRIIGDANNSHFRQTGIAVGDGLRTAMEIVKLLKVEDS